VRASKEMKAQFEKEIEKLRQALDLSDQLLERNSRAFKGMKVEYDK
jgi:hypothetical protein